MPMTQAQTARWRLIGFALSSIGAMLFAIKGVLIKLIYVYPIDTTTLLALRMLFSMPVFIGVGVVEWRRMSPSARPDRRMIAITTLVGMLGYYVSSWLDFAGLVTLEAQTERLILFTYPFLVILFGRLLLKHPMRAHALGGAGLSYAGLFIMFASDPTRLSHAMLTGAALVAAAAVTFALYQLYAREMIVKCGPSLFTAIAMSGAGVAVLLHFAVTHPIAVPVLPVPAWNLILALAVFATIVPSFMMSAGTARIGAQGTAIVSTLSPVVTIVLAIVILGEPFGMPEAIGTLFVIGGVGLFSFIDSRKSIRRETA